MIFNGYLSNSEINSLSQAALNSSLFGIARDIILNGIPPAFIAGLRLQPSPLGQFTLDLVEINRVERMEEGIVPLVLMLENIVAQLRLRGRVEARDFEVILNRIGNRAAGVPVLPDPATLPEVVTNEAIIGEDDMVGIDFLKRGIDIGAAVARIKVPRFDDGAPAQAANGGPWINQGTAWMIAPGVAITNHHVINARRAEEPPASRADFEEQATHSVLEFDFDSKEAETVQASVGRLLMASPELDYALLELSGAPPRGIPKLMPARLVHNAVSRSAVNIVQHPRGDPKRVAFRNNFVSGADGTTIRYFTDTDIGSSGAPVCDDRWQVVALHRGAQHAGKVNYRGRDSAYVNFGTQIQAVLEDVGVRNPAVADRITSAQPT
jgi:V8-like Glu-specific endopeptidase